jgi:hypothetical protein
MAKLWKTLTIAFLVAALAPAAPSLLNGDFENYLLGDPNVVTWYAVYPGQPNIGDWTVESSSYADDPAESSVDIVLPAYWTAQSGNVSIDLSGFDAGGLSQNITGLEIGHKYKVSFWVARNIFTAYTAVEADVSVGSNPILTVSTGGGDETSGLLWSLRSYYFTATSTSELLRFTSRNVSTGGIVLDNIIVEEIPEAGTWMLIGSGLVLIAWACRRQSARAQIPGTRLPAK